MSNRDAYTPAGKAAVTNQTLTKSFTQSASPTNGLTFYGLEAGAKELSTVITPLRNQIPRVMAVMGSQANWKAVTGVNINAISASVSEGNRGGVVTTSVQDYMAAFRGFGLEDYVTYEADYASEGFTDVKTLAISGLLRALMIAEEKAILGGNTGFPLGAPTAPSLADLSTGGGLAANSAVSVRVAALTLDGYMTGSVVNGVRGVSSRTNADGSVDTYGGGTSKVSTATAITTANDGSVAHRVTASTPAVTGAVGYAWFWGSPGSEVLGAITSINSVVISAAATGSQTAASLGTNDNSTNGLVYDGLLTQVVRGGGYYVQQPTGAAGTGTPLTADGVGGVVELDTALKWFWDNYRLSPTSIWVSSQEQHNITQKVLTGGQNGAQRFIINVDQGKVAGGDLVTSYLNKYGMDGATSIPIRSHPNMAPGTILFDTDTLPYPLSGVASVKRMLCRRDYYQIEWPMKSRRYEYGVYFDGVLQNYFPPSFGIITNIANG